VELEVAIFEQKLFATGRPCNVPQDIWLMVPPVFRARPFQTSQLICTLEREWLAQIRWRL